MSSRAVNAKENEEEGADVAADADTDTLSVTDSSSGIRSCDDEFRGLPEDGRAVKACDHAKSFKLRFRTSIALVRDTNEHDTEGWLVE